MKERSAAPSEAPAGVRLKDWGELRSAIAGVIANRPDASSLVEFYKARDHAPVWVTAQGARREAQLALELIKDRPGHGLEPDPRAWQAAEALLAKGEGKGRLRELATAEILISEAWSLFVQDIHRPGQAPVATDPDLPGWSKTAGEVLLEVAEAPDLAGHLRATTSINPVYDALRAELQRRVLSGADDGPGLGTDRAILRRNLDRARAIQPDPQGRFVLVNIAAAELSYYDHGAERGRMRVVVGRPQTPTPEMSALIRGVAYDPYWNVPPDLVRSRIARRMSGKARGWFSSEGFEALSGWTPDASVLTVSQIDWSAVVRGAHEVRVRQKPGPANMLGKVKFLMPNRLGVYLHDTPAKSLMKQKVRTFSAGCVRLEDADRLLAWLGAARPESLRSRAREVQRELSAPVPVYLLYLTVFPGADGVRLAPDPYGLDRMQVRAAGALADQASGGR